METKIKVLWDNVLIEPLKQDGVTESGILLVSGDEKECPQQGKVVGIGKKGESELKEGDIVIFDKYVPNIIDIDKKQYLIVKEKDILAIIYGG